MNELLGEDQCKRILQNFSPNENNVLESYTIKPLTQLNGFIADASIVTIKYSSSEGPKELRAFAKALKNTNPVIYKMSLDIKAYERETLYYTKILPILDRNDYAPKCYLSENFVVVLEDLQTSGYASFPKNEPLDLDQCVGCLETLAKFHAYPIVYETKISKELGREFRFSEEGDCLKSLLANESVQLYFHHGIEGLGELIDHIEDIEWDKNKFKSKLVKLKDMMFADEEEQRNVRSTIIHGDLWCSNFMVKKLEDKSSCLLIDFQTVQYGAPASDVMQFFYSNTTSSFREDHQQELLDHYYEAFKNVLKENGLDPEEILSESEFKSTCEEYALPAMLFAMVDRCITTVSNEDHYEASGSEESYKKFLFEDRGKFVIKTFEEDVGFRKRIREDIEDINEMLGYLE